MSNLAGTVLIIGLENKALRRLADTYSISP